jgi:hypothetical protein
MLINNTHFHFTEAASTLSFDAVMSMEMGLLKILLEAGWGRWQYRNGYEGIRIRTEAKGPRELDVRETELNIQMARHKGHKMEEHDEENGREENGQSRASCTPTHSQMSFCYSPERPTGIITPDLDSITKTPVRPIVSRFVSMSASQPAISRIDHASAPFQPRRKLSNPTIFAHSEASEGSLGFGIGIGDVTDNGSDREKESPAHHSAAVDIRHRDGSPAIFSFGTLSIRHEIDQANAPTGYMMSNNVAAKQASPSYRRTINAAADTTPTKTPNRKVITIASTIHEEVEGTWEDDNNGDNADGDGDVTMSTGRGKHGFKL